ncbi:hypothetical protein [Halobacteriovorax sp. HLS]|uniref:hypothetical protein n=1 Tax=Halobacteriovorax sp. HLS TaxID=2234000 RepID=UPI000FDB35DC|nr:hypothetical protein [Halobacteriovorax sp. HLS]
MIQLAKSIIIFSITIFCANAIDLTEQARKYIKCHSQFLNKRVDLNDPILIDLNSGKTDAKKACLQIISHAKFSKSGQLENLDSKSFTVLNTFQNLHSSWFKLYNFNSDTQDHSNTNVFDSNQAAYHFTLSLFGQSYPLNNIFLSSKTLKAKRVGNDENIFQNDRDISAIRSHLDGMHKRKWSVGGVQDNPTDFGETYLWKPELIEFGQLYAITELDSSTQYFTRLKESKRIEGINLKKSRFPGAFGSISYLMLNAGHNNRTTDGAEKLHRRWAQNLFSDFLCRDLPLIKTEDATYSKNSKISFRKKSSCMHCHLSIDPLASTIRNLEIFNAGEVFTGSFTFRAIQEHPAIHDFSDNLDKRDKYFFQRPPTGKLIFRDIYGKLISKKLSSPAQIGKELAKLDDPYICTASRYFEFLTGEKNLITENSFSIENLTQKKEFILELAKELKESGDLSKVIGELISSKFYVGVSP